MAVVSKTVLKSYFETGDIPTEAQYIDLIDTLAELTSPEFATSIIGSYLTANEILITDGSKGIISAPVATYPSLTELTYLKGVSSAIQTQINKYRTESFIISCSDLTTALTTGTSKAYFRLPYAFTLTEVRASVLTAPTGSGITVGINNNGGSILSTDITIDATTFTSEDAATPPVISVASFSSDAEITIDIDAVGSTIAGSGLAVTLIGYKT